MQGGIDFVYVVIDYLYFGWGGGGIEFIFQGGQDEDGWVIWYEGQQLIICN